MNARRGESAYGVGAIGWGLEAARLGGDVEDYIFLELPKVGEVKEAS